MTLFKEVARIAVAPARDIVVSEVIENGEVKGLNINSFVTTDKYTGFTKGTFVPAEKIEDFKAVVAGL